MSVAALRPLGRFVRWAALVTVAAFTIAAVAMYARYASQQKELEIRRTLAQTLSTDESPDDLTEDWDAQRARLERLLEDDPESSLALLTYRASADIDFGIPHGATVADDQSVRIVYGGGPRASIPVPDEPHLWVAEFQSRVPGGEWRPLDRAAWTTGQPATVEVPVVEILPEDHRTHGWKDLNLRALVWLFRGESLPSVEDGLPSDEVLAASNPSFYGPVTLTRLRFNLVPASGP